MRLIRCIYLRVLFIQSMFVCYLERTKLMFTFLHVRIPLFEMQTNEVNEHKKRNKHKENTHKYRLSSAYDHHRIETHKRATRKKANWFLTSNWSYTLDTTRNKCSFDSNGVQIFVSALPPTRKSYAF